MKPARFDYARPDSLPEVLSLLDGHSGDAAILAGGQSLMAMLNLRLSQPSLLVDINGVPHLDVIERVGDVLRIGARARHNDVLRSPLVAETVPLLVQVLSHVAHEAIRNRGTFGGSLALADPSAELPACALALDATIVAVSMRGERSIQASEFFEGMYTTTLEPDELLLRVEIPIREGSWRFAFDEVTRRHGDYALAALALSINLVDGRIAESRVALSAVESHQRRLPEVEAALVGSALVEAVASGEAVAMMKSVLEPLDGAEYPAAYRAHLAATLLTRLLKRIQA